MVPDSPVWPSCNDDAFAKTISMTTPIISVENLTKRYRLGQIGMTSLKDDLERWWHRRRGIARGAAQYEEDAKESEQEFWALKGVSFEVQEGEVLGIIGKNGAGKSTLLKLLSRITEPTSGRAVLRGRVASLLEVGTGFHPDLTGRENVYLNGTTLGMTKREIDRKFDEIVDFSGIEKFIDTPVKRYSSGMTVRLGFAVAAHLEPEILIVDEVLAVGDAEFQKRCLGKMQSVSRDSGRTVIFVSHNMNAVESICNRALMLVSGTVQKFSSDVTGIVRHYLDENVGSSISSSWQNVGEDFPNKWFVPHSMKVATDNESHILRRGDEAYVCISGQVNECKNNLQIGYALFTSDHSLIYWSTFTDGIRDQWPTLRPGFLELSSRIPLELLNEGEYRVELFLGLHHERWITEPGVNSPAVSFSVSGKLSDSPHWVERRPGILAPNLSWNAKQIHQHENKS